MPIDVEIGRIAVHALAHQIGHPAHGENIATAIECEAILVAQPLAALHLLRNRLQRRIVGLKGVARPGLDCIAVHSPILPLRTLSPILSNPASHLSEHYVPSWMCRSGTAKPPSSVQPPRHQTAWRRQGDRP